jgi:LPXTG-site transpeptidase (sortase) family protein
MNIRFNNLLIAGGAVLIAIALLSAGKDIGRAVPMLLSSISEVKGEESVLPAGNGAVIQEGKLARSLVEKARAEPAAAVLPGIERYNPAETPSEQVSAAPNLAPDAKVTTAEVDALPEGEVPVQLVIPAIGLDAPVVPADTVIVKKDGQEFQQWKSPNKRAVGWQESSALLGQPGNTVMNGHHNIYGKVFARLVDLEPGDLIVVYGKRQAYVYEVANKMLLREKYQDLDLRMDNARWILPSEDERLTLVTCWPPETNTHRLIIVARPLGTGP